ncbi:MAG: pilus assembly PilX family protein [Pseudomonadota bacterium]
MKRIAVGIRANRGIVLPLSLVMLVMVTLLAVVAIRGVTTEERIAANLRSSAVGFEMAELALRHCEDIVWNGQDPTGTIKLDAVKFVESPPLGTRWDPPSPANANWADPARSLTPPNVPTGLAVPRCMIEEALGDSGGYTIRFARGTRPTMYVVTARGFGDGSTTNFPATVQSQLRPNPIAP